MPPRNLIRRREETAATRSLLNTARLIGENPLLLPLKELESMPTALLELRGLDRLLTQLVGSEARPRVLRTPTERPGLAPGPSIGGDRVADQ